MSSSRYKNARCGVYRILNRSTGDCYIGSSKQIEFRWEQHCSLLRRGKHTNERLQRSWDKYGSAAFVFEVVLEVGLDRLLAAEQEQLNSERPAYNLNPVAGHAVLPLGYRHSDEAKAKMRQAKLGSKASDKTRAKMSHAHVGHVNSPEHRDRIRQAKLGHDVSVEVREKLRQSMIAQHLSGSRALTTAPLSADTKRKISEAMKGRGLGVKQPPDLVAKRWETRRHNQAMAVMS